MKTRPLRRRRHFVVVVPVLFVVGFVFRVDILIDWDVSRLVGAL